MSLLITALIAVLVPSDFSRGESGLQNLSCSRIFDREMPDPQSVSSRIQELAPRLIRELRSKYGHLPVFITSRDAEVLKQSVAPEDSWEIFYSVFIAVAQRHSIHQSIDVGAVGVGRSGNIYLGFNLELPGQDVNDFIHAEQVAIANARMHHEKQLDHLLISAEPCGSCRQAIASVNGDRNTLLVTFPHQDQILRLNPSQLLPYAFGDSDGGLLRIESGKIDGPFNVHIVDRDGRIPRFGTRVSTLTDFQERAVQAAAEGRTRYDTYRGAALQLTLEGGESYIAQGSFVGVPGANHSLREIVQILLRLVSMGFHLKETSDGGAGILVGPEGQRIQAAQAVLVQATNDPFSGVSDFKTLFQGLLEVSGYIEVLRY